MVKLNLILIRHGVTNANQTQIIQGQLDEPLNDDGCSQAEKVGIFFQNVAFDCVLSSDLRRAFQTASILLSCNKVTPKSHKIFKKTGLRERKYGVLEGQPLKLRSELAEKDSVSSWEYSPQNGETLQDFRLRVLATFRDLCKYLYNKFGYLDLNGAVSAGLEENDPKVYRPTVLVVSHGGFLKELFKFLTDEAKLVLPPQVKRATSGRVCPNTGWSRLTLCLGGAGQVKSVSCEKFFSVEHLTHKQEAPLQPDAV